MAMILSIGMFVSGITPHLHTLSCSRLCRRAATDSPAHQSNGPGETVTWDWPPLTKETVIDRRRRRSLGTVTERRAGSRGNDASRQRCTPFNFTSYSNFYLVLKVSAASRETIRQQGAIRALDCGGVFEWTNHEMFSGNDVVLFKDLIRASEISGIMRNIWEMQPTQSVF